MSFSINKCEELTYSTCGKFYKNKICITAALGIVVLCFFMRKNIGRQFQWILSGFGTTEKTSNTARRVIKNNGFNVPKSKKRFTDKTQNKPTASTDIKQPVLLKPESSELPPEVHVKQKQQLLTVLMRKMISEGIQAYKPLILELTNHKNSTQLSLINFLVKYLNDRMNKNEDDLYARQIYTELTQNDNVRKHLVTQDDDESTIDAKTRAMYYALIKKP